MESSRPNRIVRSLKCEEKMSKLGLLNLKKMLQWDLISCLQLLLPWEVVESPSLEMFKTCLAMLSYVE